MTCLFKSPDSDAAYRHFSHLNFFGLMLSCTRRSCRPTLLLVDSKGHLVHLYFLEPPFSAIFARTRLFSGQPTIDFNKEIRPCGEQLLDMGGKGKGWDWGREIGQIRLLFLPPRRPSQSLGGKRSGGNRLDACRFSRGVFIMSSSAKTALLSHKKGLF